MVTAGIIVEYNPLHNGHVHHFEQTRAITGATNIVAVMSGHFLQRGEPAVMNKWARAQTALAMGADIVLELPVAYASQPAEWFAFGAVSALEKTGVVDAICFGSESGRIEWLQTLATAMADEPEPFRRRLMSGLKKGLSYPRAYTDAMQSLTLPRTGGSDEGFRLDLPNNTLGLHYLIALHRLGSRMRPFTIPRTKAGYRQEDITDRRIASATALRRLLFESGELEAVRPFVPPYTLEILEREASAGRAPLGWEAFASPLFYALLGQSRMELGRYHEVNEGLEHRIRTTLPRLESPPSVEQLLDTLKTRRYTRTKLQRTLLRILLNHRKSELSRDMLAKGVPYLRVLGFSENGRALLKRMKTSAKVPIVTQASRSGHPFMDMDARATAVYANAYNRPGPDDWFRDYYQAPIRTGRV